MARGKKESLSETDSSQNVVCATPSKKSKVRENSSATVRNPKAMARTPDRAEELKARLQELMTATQRIKSMKRSLDDKFFDIAEILAGIEERKLFEVKGYSNFASFAAREVDLPQKRCEQLVRIFRVFQRDAALEAGLERITVALTALDERWECIERTPLPATRRSHAALPVHKL